VARRIVIEYTDTFRQSYRQLPEAIQKGNKNNCDFFPFPLKKQEPLPKERPRALLVDQSGVMIKISNNEPVCGQLKDHICWTIRLAAILDFRYLPVLQSFSGKPVAEFIHGIPRVAPDPLPMNLVPAGGVLELLPEGLDS
jgi:hypothetical protein